MSSRAMLLPDDPESDASGVETVGYYLPDCNLPSAPSSAIFDSGSGFLDDNLESICLFVSLGVALGVTLKEELVRFVCRLK